MKPAQAAEFRSNRGGSRFAILPCHIDFQTTARAETHHTSFRPACGQRWQQADGVVVTLQQHFGDSRSRAKVAVDLKRRMRIKEVIVAASLKADALRRAPTSYGSKQQTQQ